MSPCVPAVFLSLRNPHQAHREPVVPIAAARGIEIARHEVHAVGVVRIRRVGRRRPVVAVGAGTVNRRPMAEARRRQEHATLRS